MYSHISFPNYKPLKWEGPPLPAIGSLEKSGLPRRGESFLLNFFPRGWEPHSMCSLQKAEEEESDWVPHTPSSSAQVILRGHTWGQIITLISVLSHEQWGINASHQRCWLVKPYTRSPPTNAWLQCCARTLFYFFIMLAPNIFMTKEFSIFFFPRALTFWKKSLKYSKSQSDIAQFSY